jgi:hypothetical protein
MSTVDIIFVPKFNGIIYVSSKDQKTQIAYDVDFAVRATFVTITVVVVAEAKSLEKVPSGERMKRSKQWREGKFWNMENTLWCTFEQVAKQFGKIHLTIIENGQYSNDWE